MLLPILQLLVGFVLLTYGAERLVNGSSALALKLGLTPLVIGITVVAFGTSAPELVVSIRATLAGNSEIAIGNVIGSNIANIALILGVTAVIRPMLVHRDILRVELPTMIGVTLIASLFIISDEITRLEGVLLFVGLIIFIVFSLYRAKNLPEEVRKQIVEVPDESIITTPIWKSWVLVLLGLVLLVLGGELLVNGAVEIARIFGISEAIIGITIVSIGTSLPELATSAVAAIKKEADIAIGNIIGSNVFNLLSILGITAMINPMDSSSFDLVDLGMMLGLTLLIWPMMRRGLELNRWEGAILLLTYTGYIIWLLVE